MSQPQTLAEKKAADEKAAAAAEKKADAADDKASKSSKAHLAAAGQSGDPAVQRLLAERMGHELSLLPDPSLAEQREKAEKAIKKIDDELAELGYK